MIGDYDHEPKQKTGKFLLLKDKGQVIKVRLASRPYRNPKVWQEGVRAPWSDQDVARMGQEEWYKAMGNPEIRIAETYCWVVIDREDNMARILQVTAGVYKSIKEYANDPDWGDPRGYDITIIRTEEPGRGYYSVKPSPNKQALTYAEEQRVKELDIAKELPNARPTGERQVDDIDDYIMEVAQNVSVDKKTDSDIDNELLEAYEAVFDVNPDEPINLDNLPFSEDPNMSQKGSGNN